MTAERPEAFGVFYRRHADQLLGFLVRQTRDAEVAADLMAETFAAAVLGARRYQRRAEPARAWLYAIARNKLIDSRRHGRVVAAARVELALPTTYLDDTDLLRALELEEAVVAVDEMLAPLSDAERSAIRARVLDERDYADIARELNRSEAVVRQRVSRGLRTLQARLKESA